MKRIINYIFSAMLLLSVVSCEKDNYDGPNAEIHGAFIDPGTGQPIPSDIATGTTIEIIEHYMGQPPSTVVTQTLVVKNDGTYRNSQVFAGDYLVRIGAANFPRPAQIDKHNIAKGSNELNFNVTPYIRVKNVQITKTGRIVTATFQVEQPVASTIARVGLYVHSHKDVGANLQLARQEVTLNRNANAGEVFTITMDLDAESRSTWNVLRPGEEFFFRVGALSSASGARHNYASSAPVKLRND